MKQKAHLLALVYILCAISGCTLKDEPFSAELPELKNATISENFAKMVPAEMIVKFKEGTSDFKKSDALAKIEGKQKGKIITKMMERYGDKEGLTLVHVSGSLLEAVNKMKGNPDIEYAEPNYIYTHNAISNDTYYLDGNLWGMYGQSSAPANPYGCGAYRAWASGHTGSASVYVGIIDEGYMVAHEDLSGNAGKNPGEIAGNGIDDDKNGYVDDVYGWDFFNNDNTVFDGIEDDHGTHVAGTIGAIGGNRKGVAGVCWNIKLLNAKFLGPEGGTTANAVLAVDYFTELKIKQGINIVALNNSWGGGGYSEALKEAIQRASANNILFIAAAGNDVTNSDISPYYPAGYSCENIIAVASINTTGALSYFSNYGATSVDLGAPGSGIYSTIPKLSKTRIVSGYAMYSGTSMATPHVTGAAALFAASHPGASASNIKSAILSSVTPTPALTGKCMSGGRLNINGF